jgi:hypothetical protein
VFLSGPAVWSAEAVLPTGEKVRGSVQLKNGRLFFTPSRRQPALRLDQVDHVRFPLVQRPPARSATLHRITLIDGQCLTGELLSLDGQDVRCRPTWLGGARTLTLPRSAVVSVGQLPGYATFIAEDFEAGCKGWKLTGRPELSDRQHVSGKRSLLLDAPGQTAEYTLAEPLDAGGAGINFHDPLVTKGSRWLVEADFRGENGPQTVRVAVADPSDRYSVEVPGGKRAGFPVRRTAGWHRLYLEFAAKRLVISVDDDLLWVSRENGPAGPLRKVRLACRAADKGKAQGQVFFDDFALARAVEYLRHRRADRGQDELWLLSGDQLFGRVLKADRRGIVLQARFGKRSWGWGEVRGIYLRETAAPPRTLEGEQVEVRIRTGAGPESDRVVGQVRGLDDKQLTLAHPLLGELVIERTRLRRLRWLFHGRRIELDNTAHHLGPKEKLVAGLYPARAEGVTATWKFNLKNLPATARLYLQATHVQGKEDGNAGAWERGELRAEVVVNGKVVDYLNRYVNRSTREPQRLTIVLPRKVLRAGRNILQVRQAPERQTRHYEHCGVSDLVLEFQR